RRWFLTSALCALLGVVRAHLTVVVVHRLLDGRVVPPGITFVLVDRLLVLALRLVHRGFELRGRHLPDHVNQYVEGHRQSWSITSFRCSELGRAPSRPPDGCRPRNPTCMHSRTASRSRCE